MHISWLGNTAIKIQTKPMDREVTIVIDPYRPTAGAFPRSLAPQIAIFARGQDGAITLSGPPFVLATAGEIETHQVLITAVQGHAPGQIMVRVDSEGISLGHLGLTKLQPTEAQLDVLGDVDILCVPVGNGESFDAEGAMKAVNAIEPRVVIPIAYKSDTDPKAKPVDEFLKAMGAATEKAEKKVTLKKKDLPQEEMKIIVLAKE